MTFHLKYVGNESIGIVGESASGKSTLGAAIIRSVNPPGRIVRGKVYVNGKNVLDLSESYFNREMRWKKIAVVFQGAMNSSRSRLQNLRTVA